MASSSFSESCEYDVFLSFNGEDDALKTFVDDLYLALEDLKISAYKDDEEGESLSKAIKDSRIAVIIFSNKYADSSRCLDELTHVMKCRDERGLIVMPIFYDVDPSDMRKQKRKFGEAFAKQEAESIIKAELWRKALIDASKIAGWELQNIAIGDESRIIKSIADTILNTPSPLNPGINEDLVGMGRRLQELESLLNIGSGGVRMVGICGMRGSGKTTLAASVYMKIAQHFEGHCFVKNVREEANTYGLSKLQRNILSTICKREVQVNSVVEGIRMMKSMLYRRKVLVLLDDVDHLDQLEALAGRHNWFGSGSRIIITSRDGHLLGTHKVDLVYDVMLLSEDEALQLFKRHAYNEEDPVEDYDTLSLGVVPYAVGLPLAIKVLGSFLYGKDKNEWISALATLKRIPLMRIPEKLKIGYDGLETYEKELFLDIACFFKGWNIDDAMDILEACGFYPKIGIQVLRQKALISIVDGRLDMHDLLQEMGKYIVRGEHPHNSEKHSRVWKHEEIRNMFFSDATMENEQIKAIRYDGYSHDQDHSSHFCKIVSKMKKLRLLIKSVSSERDVDADGANYLSNELRYIHWELYPTSPFPGSFQPTNLVVLKLWGSMQKELWEGYKHLPNLKVLQLKSMWELLSTPDFNGFPRLQKLTLSSCKELVEIHPSFGNHTSLEYLSISECPKLRMFPTIVHMKYLETLEIKDCFLGDGEIPSGIGELSNLQELNLAGNDFSRLDFNLSPLTWLKLLDLSYCVKLLELPKLPSNSAILKADYCSLLKTVGDCHNKCERLYQVSLMGGGIINDGGRLLQSMLERKAIVNGSMLLRLKGLDVVKGFTPLFRGRRCRLQLPDNWCNDFCGFLICAVFPSYFHWSDRARIIISHVTSGMDSKDDVVWEESDGDSDKHTFVWYVSFGSLRHAKWWDHTYKALEFNIEDYGCCGFGVWLFANKSRSALSETSTYSSDYAPRLEIGDDLESALTIALKFSCPETIICNKNYMLNSEN